MNFSEQLLTWYDQHGRKDLPWQQYTSPYHIWLSEIMLQQTQVNTVIPYYQRFIRRYSTITTLATASVDDVLSLWSGLGYYARARNLHKTAHIIHEKHQGIMPTNLDTLIALPGIGRSTAGAIMSLAHKQPYAILDGNVKRVLSRYYRIKGWPGIKSIENELWQHAENLLPNERIEHYIQAQMDLGATVCTRTKPDCLNCPLQTDCQAFQHDIPQNYPFPKPKKTIPTRKTHWLILRSQSNEILLQQRPSVGIWGDLWSFPELDSAININAICKQEFHVDDLNIIAQTEFKHVFSHFKLYIHPHLIDCIQPINYISEKKNEKWYMISKALQLGLPAPVKKILQTLQ